MIAFQNHLFVEGKIIYIFTLYLRSNIHFCVHLFRNVCFAAAAAAATPEHTSGISTIYLVGSDECAADTKITPVEKNAPKIIALRC